MVKLLWAGDHPSVSSRYLLIYANGGIDVNGKGARFTHFIFTQQYRYTEFHGCGIRWLVGSNVTLNGAQTVYYESTGKSATRHLAVLHGVGGKFK